MEQYETPEGDVYAAGRSIRVTVTGGAKGGPGEPGEAADDPTGMPEREAKADGGEWDGEEPTVSRTAIIRARAGRNVNIALGDMTVNNRAGDR